MTAKRKARRGSRVDDVLEDVRAWYFKENWIGDKRRGFRHVDTIRLRILETRLGHAIGWMRTNNGKPRKGLCQTQDEAADFCENLLKRVFDDTRCNDDCKFMYFCDEDKNHKGKHKSQGLSWD